MNLIVSKSGEKNLYRITISDLEKQLVEVTRQEQEWLDSITEENILSERLAKLLFIVKKIEEKKFKIYGDN